MVSFKLLPYLAGLAPAAASAAAARLRRLVRPLKAVVERAGDDQPHDFVGALEDLVHAQVAHDTLDFIVCKIAVAAVDLQRLVGDVEAGVGDEALGLGGVGDQAGSVLLPSPAASKARAAA